MIELLMFSRFCPTFARIAAWTLIIVMLAFLLAFLVGCSNHSSDANPMNDPRLKKAQAAYMAGQAANTTKALHDIRIGVEKKPKPVLQEDKF